MLPGLARAISPVMPSITPAGKAGAALARLVTDPTLDVTRWTLQFVERFARDVEARLARWK